jgi:uncharacterized protein YceK
MNAKRIFILAITLGSLLSGCKNVEITTETTEKTYDQDNKVVSEKTIKTTQTDESFTFGLSEGNNKQINIVPLDISVVK